jgi:type IV secretion system protein VirB6
LGLLFTFKIIQAILIILFALFITGMIIYFVHAYLIAKFGLVLLIYLAPLFVPLALFEQTKQFFQGWMKLAFSFALQPVIIAAFIALIFTVFDEVLYNTCQFDSQVITPVAQGCKEYQVFSVKNSSVNDSQCNSTFGYFLAQKSWSTGTNTVGGGIVNLPSTSVNLDLSQLIYIVVFAFLFFNFSQMIGALAADLTGGVEISAKNVTGQLVGQGAKAIFGGSKAMAKGAASLGMKAASAVKGPRPPAPRP